MQPRCKITQLFNQKAKLGALMSTGDSERMWFFTGKL
ncbi:Uncharacterised protein [Vibrio cholerae]|nr:Uncharacterised protein [Vibrio cholerae]CSI51480.1 Uncharacterised protein [Vibrio cholerae]